MRWIRYFPECFFLPQRISGLLLSWQTWGRVRLCGTFHRIAYSSGVSRDSGLISRAVNFEQMLLYTTHLDVLGTPWYHS